MHKLPYAIRVILAFIFFIIGILGLVLPFLQGWFFLGLALHVLYPEKSLALRKKIFEKWHHIRGKMVEYSEKKKQKPNSNEKSKNARSKGLDTRSKTETKEQSISKV